MKKKLLLVVQKSGEIITYQEFRLKWASEVDAHQIKKLHSLTEMRVKLFY